MAAVSVVQKGQELGFCGSRLPLGIEQHGYVLASPTLAFYVLLLTFLHPLKPR